MRAMNRERALAVQRDLINAVTLANHATFQ
jgi:hypothetical protein